MYTSGHVEILRDALNTAAFKIDDASDLETLVKAVSYPDFPCGKIEIVGSDVVVDRMESCGFVKLALSLMFDKLSLGNQSHNGFYAVWHAMTLDPDKTVENVAKNIREYIMICMKLAHERDSFFWLGFALHIVMDAYSPAHVMRRGGVGGDDHDRVTYLRLHDSELPAKDKKNVALLSSIVSKVVDGVAHGTSARAIVDAFPKRQRDTAAFVLFDHLQRRTLKPCESSSSSSSSSSSKCQVMNFYYYPQQRGLFHKDYDRISRVKEAGVYDACVSDVRAMISLFLRRRRLTKDAFLKHVCRLIETRTLRIHPGCRTVETGFDVSALLVAPKTSVFTLSTTSGRYVDTRNRCIVVSRGFVFTIPVSKNNHTTKEIVYKQVMFEHRTASVGSCRDQLRYTFFETLPGVGYPVSVKVDGFVFTRPYLSNIHTAL